MSTSTKRPVNYCAVYARRTPSIPFHNGYPACIGCGARTAREPVSGGSR